MSEQEFGKLGQLLINEGVLDEMQLRAGLGHQRRWGGRIGEALVNLGFITESELIKFLSETLDYSAVDLSRSRIAPKTFEALPQKIAEQFKVVPIVIRDTPGKPTMVLAMDDPTDLGTISEIEFATNHKIEPVVAIESAIAKVLASYGESPADFVQEDTSTISISNEIPQISEDEPMELMRDNAAQMRDVQNRESRKVIQRPDVSTKPQGVPKIPGPASNEYIAPLEDEIAPLPDLPEVIEAAPKLEVIPDEEPELLELEDLGVEDIPPDLSDVEDGGVDEDSTEFTDFGDNQSVAPAQATPDSEPAAQSAASSEPAGTTEENLTERVVQLEAQVSHLWNLLLRLSKGELTIQELEQELNS